MFLKNPEAKAGFFKQSIILLTVLATFIVIALVLNKHDLDDIGLAFLKDLRWVAGLLGVPLIWLWLVNKIKITGTRNDKVRRQYADVIDLLPKTAYQYKWGIGLSFAAGIFEEIIYRGFLFWQLNEFMPTVLAVIVANFIFGLSHYATKFKNASRAFLLGMVWSLSFLFTGSLWLAMITHIAIDLFSMTIVYKAQMTE